MLLPNWRLLFLMGLAIGASSQGLQEELEEQHTGFLRNLDLPAEQIFVGKAVGDSPGSGSLFERQLTCRAATPLQCGSGCCPASNSCCTTTCCPLGTSGTCCPAPMRGCCPNNTNCMPSLDVCCPKNAQTCGGNFCWEPGSVCCNGGTYSCKAGGSCCGSSCCGPGKTCCQGQGCCESGEKCCPGACCPSDSECSNRYGYCVRRTTTTRSISTQTTTRSTTSSRRTTTQTTSTQTTTRTIRETSQTTRTTTGTTTVTAPPTTTTTRITTPRISSSTTTSSSRGCRTTTAPPQATAAPTLNLPVLTFVYVGGGIADDIPVNICLGIRHKLGFSSNSIVLTYAGDGRRCTRGRGRQSGCSRCCQGVRKLPGTPNAGDATECDEFPFKSTVEGGDGAWIRCVTNWQNQLQGNYLSSWYTANSMQPGDRFVVEVTNLDCSTVRPTQLQSCGGAIVRRQQTPLPVASGSEVTIRRTLDNRTNVVVAPLGDLDGGSFGATWRMVDGRLNGARLTDSDGEEIDDVSDLDDIYANAGFSMTWDLDDYVGGIGFIGETDSSRVNLTWELVESPAATTTPSPPPESAPSSSLSSTSASRGWRAIHMTTFSISIAVGVFVLTCIFF